MGDFRGGLICLSPWHKGPLVSTIFIFHSIVFVDSLAKKFNWIHKCLRSPHSWTSICWLFVEVSHFIHHVSSSPTKLFSYGFASCFHDLHNLITKQCLVSTTFACATSCVFLDPNTIIQLPIYITVICKVTLSLGLLSPPIPSFSGIRKVKEILLNLSIKCWNSAFNAQGSRVSLSPKLVEKLVWVSVISPCKIFILS